MFQIYPGYICSKYDYFLDSVVRQIFHHLPDVENRIPKYIKSSFFIYQVRSYEKIIPEEEYSIL